MSGARYPDAPLPHDRSSARAPASGLAIASFACGVLSLVTFGLTAVPALIFGVAAWRQAGHAGGRSGGMAMAGGVLGAIGLVILAVAVISTR